MARELKGLGAGLIAGLFVVGASFGVSAIVTHWQPTKPDQNSQPAPKSSGKTAVASTQLVAMGGGLYLQACARCHGQKAEGVRGPSLRGLSDPDAKIARNIANGFSGQMPAYKSRYNAAQIQALVAYIQSLK